MTTPKRPLLTVCCGLPGSGKSTWARVQALGELPNTYVVSADAVRIGRDDAAAVFERMQRDARRALRGGLNVIVDACSLDPRNRMTWLRLGRECNAMVRLVVFNTPLEVCQARDAARPAHERAAVDWRESATRLDRVLERVGVEQWDWITFVPHVVDVPKGRGQA